MVDWFTSLLIILLTGHALLMTNLFPILVVGTVAAILMVGIRWVAKTSSLQKVLRLILMTAAFLGVTYNATRNYAWLWTIIPFKIASAEVSREMLLNEYWYRIFVAPFFPEDCYFCEQACEKRMFVFKVDEKKTQQACFGKLPAYYDRKIPMSDRISAFTTSIFFGLLVCLVSLIVEKGIYGLRVNFLTQKVNQL